MHLLQILLALLHVKATIVLTLGIKRQPYEKDTGAQDHHGTSFLLGFLEMDNRRGTSTIYVTCESIAAITLFVPSLNITTTKYATPEFSTKFELPPSVRMQGIQRENKGILLTSNVSVSVYATNARTRSRDAYLILPSSSLGTQHVVVTFAPKHKSLVGVVALHDKTMVQIRLKIPLHRTATYLGRTYQNGDILRVFLNKLDTFQLQSNMDLTGTFVISSTPVVVLGGNICARVPVGPFTCSHLATQLLPVSRWGKQFITAPIPGRRDYDVLRMVAAYNDTVVSIIGKTNYTLNAGEMREFLLRRPDMQYIRSSRPAMLVQFNQGSNGRFFSEAFALMVSPVEQYTTTYSLPIPVKKIVPAFMNHLTYITDEPGITSSFNASKYCSNNLTSIQVPESNYTVTTCELRANLNVSSTIPIKDASEHVRFGVFVVGHTDADGYGYLGGMRLRYINCEHVYPERMSIGDTLDNDCDGRIDEEMRNGVDDDGDGRVDEDLGVEISCNVSSVVQEREPQESVYLQGSDPIKYSVSSQGQCKKLVTRTWSFTPPNGTFVIARVQKIRWQKKEAVVRIPNNSYVTTRNLSTVEKQVRKMSFMCPGDKMEFSEDRQENDDGTTTIRRTWMVTQDCGRIITANHTIIVHSEDSPKPEKLNASTKLLIILSVAVSALVIAMIAMCVAFSQKLKTRTLIPPPIFVEHGSDTLADE